MTTRFNPIQVFDAIDKTAILPFRISGPISQRAYELIIQILEKYALLFNEN